MPRIMRYIGQTVAVMTECNKLVVVEFNQLPGGDIELSLLNAGMFTRLRGYGLPVITGDDYKARPSGFAAEASWAIGHFDLKVKTT